MLACGEPSPEKKLKNLIKKAESGDVESQLTLGYEYSSGGGLVRKDHSEAESWFKKASFSGNFEAKHALASILLGKNDYIGAEMALVNCYSKRCKNTLGLLYYDLKR